MIKLTLRRDKKKMKISWQQFQRDLQYKLVDSYFTKKKILLSKYLPTFTISVKSTAHDMVLLLL